MSLEKEKEHFLCEYSLHERLLSSTVFIFDSLLPQRHTLQQHWGHLPMQPKLFTKVLPVYRHAIHAYFEILNLDTLSLPTPALTLPFKKTQSVLEMVLPQTLTTPCLKKIYAAAFLNWLYVWLHDKTHHQEKTLSLIDTHLRTFLHDKI